MNGEVDEFCQTCIYKSYAPYFAHGIKRGYRIGWCDYIGREKKPRPCPAGTGCTVRRQKKNG